MHFQKHPARYVPAACAALLCVLCTGIHASAEESTDAGWYSIGKKHFYRLDDGSNAVGELTLDGIPYLFARNGALQTGWQTVNGKRYFYDTDGHAVFGAFTWRGETYYIDRDCGKVTGLQPTAEGIYLANEEGILRPDVAEQDANGIWRMTDSFGALRTGWQTQPDEIRRYIDPETGDVRTGFLRLNDGTYYADAEAGQLTGLREIAGAQYFFAENGLMQTGWQTAPDQITRYFDPETGAARAGWLMLDDGIYYADAAAGRVTGLREIAGAQYFFSENGLMQTGWQTAPDQITRYFDPETGAARAGWLTLDDGTYYADAAAGRVTGLREIAGAQYLFAENGLMQTGWQTAPDQITRYFDTKSGAAFSGWLNFDEGICYTDTAEGRRTGYAVIGESGYFFDAQGYMQTGWQQTGDLTLHLEADGAGTEGLLTEDDSTYYFEKGVMQRGWHKIDGDYRYFRPDGTEYVLAHEGHTSNMELAYWAVNKIGCPYWYGTFGNIADQHLYNYKKKQYPKYYTADDFQSQMGQQVFDCVGLIKGFLWTTTLDGVTPPPEYRSDTDVSAPGMYNVSKVRGTIDTCPWTVGTLLYKMYTDERQRIHHVGVYVGNGYVVEAKGHKYGTILTSLREDPDWTHWSQCPWITDEGIVDDWRKEGEVYPPPKEPEDEDSSEGS